MRTNSAAAWQKRRRRSRTARPLSWQTACLLCAGPQRRSVRRTHRSAPPVPHYRSTRHQPVAGWPAARQNDALFEFREFGGGLFLDFLQVQGRRRCEEGANIEQDRHVQHLHENEGSLECTRATASRPSPASPFSRSTVHRPCRDRSAARSRTALATVTWQEPVLHKQFPSALSTRRWVADLERGGRRRLSFCCRAARRRPFVPRGNRWRPLRWAR